MSYCRWAPDGSCDVYVYESCSGFEVHVANTRRELVEPLPVVSVTELSDIDHEAAKRGIEPHASAVASWLARNQEHHRIIEASPTAPIELPGAGESHTFADPGEAASYLSDLAGRGFAVPRSVIDDLVEEQRDLDAVSGF